MIFHLQKWISDLIITERVHCHRRDTGEIIIDRITSRDAADFLPILPTLLRLVTFASVRM